MVRTIQTNPDAKLGFAGGVKGYDFDSLVDIYRLRTSSHLNLIKNDLIKKFANSHSDRAFHQLMNYAERTNNVSLMGKIKVCVLLVITQHIISFNYIFTTHLRIAYGEMSIIRITCYNKKRHA